MSNSVFRNAAAAVTLAIGAAGNAGAAAPAPMARSAIQAVLDASATAWNNGDLARFMRCYATGPATTYVNGAHFVHGYDAIRAMYAERFGGGSRAAMGRLSIEIVDLRMLGTRTAYVIGRFHLQRDTAHGGAATGPSTLLFKRSPAGWRIIADHS